MKNLRRYAVVLWGLFLTLSLPATGGSATSAGNTDIEKKEARPSLLIRERDVAHLKNRLAIDPQLRRAYEELRREAGEVLAQAPCGYELRGSEGLLRVSRTVLRRVYLLALMHWLEGGCRWQARLWEELARAAAFPDWHPPHFLDVAEMTHALAVAYDWLYHAWTPAQRQVLRQALVEKGLQPGLTAYRQGSQAQWWTSSASNWNVVCNSGLGLGALALREEEPRLSKEILAEVHRSLKAGLAAYAPDGGYPEGALYWSYATYYLTLFWAALETAGQEDGGLSRRPELAATGFFPLYLLSPRGRLFNFADASEILPWRLPLLWLAKKWGQPVLAWPGLQARPRHPLELLWQPEKILDPGTAGLPLDRLFRGAEVVTFRSAWQDPEGIFLGFKGGDGQWPHAHLDLGSFVLEALGQPWAVDLGPDSYELPGYFGKSRWQYYRIRAEGHNTLILGSGPEPDQVVGAQAPIIKFHSTPDQARAVANLTAAYAPRARRLWRGVALINRRQVLVQDHLQAAAPVEVFWFMHTPAEVELSPSGRQALLRRGGARLQVDLLSPEGAKFSVQPARPLPLSPHPWGQNPNHGLRKLVVRLPPQPEVRLAVALTPLRPEEKPPPPPEVIPLEDW